MIDEADEMGGKTALSVLERTPKLYEKGYNGKWSYDYGVVLRGFALLWEADGGAQVFSVYPGSYGLFYRRRRKRAGIPPG
ncbi:hypothetical protein HMSSN036_75100 [Paenibacillus macerans]|nr:hypothetical protein HMSSN036_75100 [Paenibacillus macerans]